MRGSGTDWVGDFIVLGRYELESGLCRWTKRYIAKHDVAYHGLNDGRGIGGIWEISPTWRGDFRIWPLGQGDAESEELTQEIEEPELVVEE